MGRMPFDTAKGENRSESMQTLFSGTDSGSGLTDHVEHIRRVAGIDHVGLGSDYDGIRAFPDGMGDVTGYPRLLTELARRGWTREELAKLAGENLLRVMAGVERAALELRKSESAEDMWLEPKLSDSGG